MPRRRSRSTTAKVSTERVIAFACYEELLPTMSVREYKEKKMGDQSRRGDLTKMMVEEVKEEFKTAVALVYDTQAGHFGDETCSCSACVFLRKWAHLMR